MRWREICGWPYEVSEKGDVRRTVGGKGSQQGKILKPYRHKFGYVMYDLYKDGERWKTTAHFLVATAFIGPRPSPKHEVAHNDSNPENCYFKNLRWDTRKGNLSDALKRGSFRFPPRRRGEAATNSKLTEKQVHALRADSGALSQRKLAKKYGLSRSGVISILRGESWSWLTT